jgi:hypothetical protein
VPSEPISGGAERVNGAAPAQVSREAFDTAWTEAHRAKERLVRLQPLFIRDDPGLVTDSASH